MNVGEIDAQVLYCVWNDWGSRDQIANKEKTFNNCRFSRIFLEWGFPNGRIYCTYKQRACAALGNALDWFNIKQILIDHFEVLNIDSKELYFKICF